MSFKMEKPTRKIFVVLCDDITVATATAEALIEQSVWANCTIVPNVSSYEDIKDDLERFVSQEKDFWTGQGTDHDADTDIEIYFTTTLSFIAAFIMSPNFPGFAIPSTIEVRQITITTRKNAV